MTEHPIASPSEGLVLQWSDEWYKAKVKHMTREKYMCMQAAQWGADMELDACCEWLSVPCPSYGRELRNARRPKPPSLKEEALQALYRFSDTEGHDGLTQEQIAEDYVVIRRAVESLPD